MTTENKTAKVGGAPVQLNSISQFTVYAPGGIGYAFWIRVEFRETEDATESSAEDTETAPEKNADLNVNINVNIDGVWHRSDRGPKVTVWKMRSMSLKDIEGLTEGMEVRLDIEIQSGTEHVRGQQSFIYHEDANCSAYYEAKGTCRDAAVDFIKYRDPE